MLLVRTIRARFNAVLRSYFIMFMIGRPRAGVLAMDGLWRQEQKFCLRRVSPAGATFQWGVGPEPPTCMRMTPSSLSTLFEELLKFQKPLLRGNCLMSKLLVEAFR